MHIAAEIIEEDHVASETPYSGSSISW